jgi:hypothetical protein
MEMFLDKAMPMQPLQRSMKRMQSRLTHVLRTRQCSRVLLRVSLLFWSIAIGLGLSQMVHATSTVNGFVQGTGVSGLRARSQVIVIGSVDPVPPGLQLAQDAYLENCATCHIGVPPAVLPTETWQQLIQDPQHYGVEIKPLQNPYRSLVWNYFRTFSRPKLINENIPYRLAQSRLFTALHPKVKFSQPIRLGSCVTCHPGAAKYDFQTLTSEWLNSP